MATITITVSHPVLNSSRVFTITDAEMARIATACRYKFTPEGAALISNQQAIDACTNWYWNWLSEITRKYEIDVAQKSAAAAVGKITPT